MAKILTRKWQNNIGYLLNIHQIFGKVNHLTITFHDTINNLLPVLPGNDQDLDHENIVKTYLFYQDQSANAEKSWHLSFRHFCLKLVSWMVTEWDTSFRQKYLKLGCHHLVKQVSLDLDYVFMTQSLAHCLVK